MTSRPIRPVSLLLACIAAALLGAGCESGPAATANGGGVSITRAPGAVRGPAPAGPTVAAAGSSAAGTAPAASAPAALPAAAPAAPPNASAQDFGFRFRVGDEVGIDVWQEKDLSVVQRVLRDGTIAPPLLDPMPAAGRSVRELRADLLQRYAAYLREPRITVRVVSVQSDRVFVLGEVRTPSAVAAVGHTTLLQGIAQAGGFTQDVADRTRIRVVRPAPAGGRPQVMTVDADAVLAGRARDIALQPGDVVYVPTTGLADWSRHLTQAFAPVATLLGSAGSVATTALAIREL